MKKLLALSGAMSLMLVACGGGDSGLEGSYEMSMDGVAGAGTYIFDGDGELGFEESDDSVKGSYEVTDEHLILRMDAPEEDIKIEMVLNYDDIDADVIEGEIEEMNVSGDDLDEEAAEGQAALNEMVNGTPYTLTKVEDD